MSKGTITVPATIINYRGERFDTEGVLSDDMTMVAVAIARPGSPSWTNRSNDNRSYPTRTNVYGDVCVYTYQINEEFHDEDGRLTGVSGKTGTLIMPSRSWMVMQSKDSSGERDPFFRSCWEVKTKVDGNFRGLQAPAFSSEVKNLTMKAITYATKKLKADVESDRSTLSKDYAELAHTSAEIANILESKRGRRSTSQRSASAPVRAPEISDEDAKRNVADILD